METPLELLQSLLTTPDSKCLPGLIKFCSETQVFCRDKNKVQDVAALINTSFSKSDNDEGALILLQAFLPQCPRDTINCNILSWIQHCTKRLINADNGSISTISFQVLCELIRLSKKFPEARKEIALSVIPKSLDHFIREGKREKENALVILQCLEQTLESYGKTCGMHKEEITSLIFSFLESSPQIVQCCAKCFLNLAASGSPGANCENYAKNWYIHERFLLNTLHGLMNSLFENINIRQGSYRIYDLGDFNPVIPEIIEKSLLRKKQRLTTHFQSVIEFLKVHILGSFPAPKKLLPESVLNMIWKGLSVNCSTLINTNVSADVSSLLTVISEVNLSCLKLLDALIISCRMNLVSYTAFICRILSQTLNWTNVQEWAYGVEKPLRSVRMEAYLCTTNWLSVSQACSGIKEHMDEIINCIISDINIEAPLLTLRIPDNKGKGKKHKQTRDVPVPLENIVYKDANVDVCKAALDLTTVLLSSSSTIMRPDHHKLLQDVIVAKLFHIQHTRLAKAPIPYSDEDCRLSLYKALLSLCEHYHPSYPPPINFANIIFAKGIKDSSIKILEYCTFALHNVGTIVRPVFPPLAFSITDQGAKSLNCFTSGDGSSSVRREESRRNRNTNNRNVLNSTPVRDDSITNHSFQNLENSEINKSTETIDEHINSIDMGSESGIQVAETLAVSELCSNEELSSINENVTEKDLTEQSETLPFKCSEVSTLSEIMPSDLIGNSSNNVAEECNSSTSNERNSSFVTERKRDLEENNDENPSTKKIKINGMEEDNSLTIEDSDNEMLNSFVDEVIDI